MSYRKSKKGIAIALVLLAIVLLLVNRNTNSGRKSGTTNTQVQQVIAADAPLSFTKHARCRMACRGITEEEIREVLREGHINLKKSDVNDRPCPSYAIEDKVQDGQELRIVFGVCDRQIKVITCIDLDVEYSCDCN
ncbi:hypothetical protein DBR32_02150 [Taibaiella sp. KBW10]|uniref:DUF4258 domain-containing protein n=1 Tax=Taibaiella sp. KBW10 TaxID=2153357 RepID=UPI000F5940B1|nr:DUF4258 domain-containing protein [Taibaiella sp. KBW10]RQO32429.1 hypothetical protein DBR32_02150 [Taibaiella sp. KBW10]